MNIVILAGILAVVYLTGAFVFVRFFCPDQKKRRSVYEIEDHRVVLFKRLSGGLDDPFRTFSEWGSDADRRAYANL